MRFFSALLILLVVQSCGNEASKTTPETKLDPRFDGNRRMVALLDSLIQVASPQTNYFLSGKRAAMMKANPPQFRSQSDRFKWTLEYANQLLNSGDAEGSIREMEALLQEIPGTLDDKIKMKGIKPLFDALAVAYLRLGENENCVSVHNNKSCILPFHPDAVHRKKDGSTKALDIFGKLTDVYPDDVQSRWLMNIAAMTLGVYPKGLPPKKVIDFSAQDNPVAGFKPLKNMAKDYGLDVNGLSGGAIMEDFNNDGNLDIFCSSYGLSDQVRLFFNDGKGGFYEQTDSAQLTGIKGGLNAKQADYDNDGNIDILLLRGAWLDKGGEWPNSLLHNNGDGTFSDVTFSAGMGKRFAPTETASWADVNNDGWVDVFVANENNQNNDYPCELFINNGNGTFTDRAEEWGMAGNFGYAKAANFSDFDRDGWMDLFLGCLGQENHLFMSQGKQKDGSVRFVDKAKEAGVTHPVMSFPAIVTDFDHNGFPDILVTSFPMDRLDFLAEDVGKEMLGIPTKVEKTRLFLNQGKGKFIDASKAWNIDKMIYAMGLNSGDINNDGFIDFYAGTGAFAFSTWVPNRVFINDRGKGFKEVTYQSRMGHLQKGHGVSFGDIDNDGDQDVYITLGGAVEGDYAHNALFINENKVHKFVKINFSAKERKNVIGTQVELTFKSPRGIEKRIYTVGDGGTFGANSLGLCIGYLEDEELIDQKIVNLY